MSTLEQVRIQWRLDLQQACTDYQTQVRPALTPQRQQDIAQLTALSQRDQPLWELTEVTRQYVRHLTTGYLRRSRLRQCVLTILEKSSYQPAYWLELQAQALTHAHRLDAFPTRIPTPTFTTHTTDHIPQAHTGARAWQLKQQRDFHQAIANATDQYQARVGSLSNRRAQDIAACLEATKDPQQAVWISRLAVQHIVQDIQTGWLNRSQLRTQLSNVLQQDAFQWHTWLNAQQVFVETCQMIRATQPSWAPPPKTSERQPMVPSPPSSHVTQTASRKTSSIHARFFKKKQPPQAAPSTTDVPLTAWSPTYTGD